MADDTRQIVRMDRDLIQAFGGDTSSPDLREKYFKILDRWQRAGQGRLSADRCFDLADEFPNPNANGPRFVANGGAGPAPSED